MRSSTRYRAIAVLGSRCGRETSISEDVLTGAKVVRKTGQVDSIRREAACLLDLPPGIGPSLLDLEWPGSGCLSLVREYLDVQTLGQEAMRIPAQEVPRLAHGLCQTLAHLHRAGWVYADLKPENALVGRTASGFSVRLVDFGFAHNRYAAREEVRGGTPPYWAPELLEGWAFDGRADLFSLGVVLHELFPAIRDSLRWQPILERLTQDLPAKRHPDAVVLREDIAATFGLGSAPDRLPAFPAGRMSGREALLKQITTRARSTAPIRLLLQARPGTGLSRVLLEAVLRIASEDGPPIRAFDLTRPGSAGEPGRRTLRRLLEQASASPMSVLCALEDPSPELSWSPPTLRRIFEGSSAGARWERLAVPPPDQGNFSEIIASCLGATGPEVERLAEHLHQGSEGDLGIAAEGFRWCLARAGEEQSLSWKLDPQRLSEAIDSWRAPAPPPPFSAVPAALRRPLRICARAGASFSVSLGRSLLKTFSTPQALRALLGQGYLQRPEEGRFSFLTHALWREANALGPRNAAEIDRWLVEHLVPDPAWTDEVLLACRRARRLGRRDQESAYLAQGLASAAEQRREADLQRLFAYPGEPTQSRSSEGFAQQAGTLHELLGNEWSHERLLALAGKHLCSSDPKLSLMILQQAAEGPDPRAKTEAALAIADRLADRSRDASFSAALASLRSALSGEGSVPTGVLDYFEARRAWALGRRAEALALAQRARQGLRGTTLVYGDLNLQLLAGLQFADDPAAAVATLRSALRTARGSEREAQLCHNLAHVYADLGDFNRARGCVEHAIRLGHERVSRPRLLNLRLVRAWVWACLDRTEAALGEARALLQDPAVHLVPHRATSTRLLLGHCLLHSGHGRDGLTETAAAYEEAGRMGRFAQQMESLRYLIDTALDLRAWNALAPYEEDIEAIEPPEDPIARTTLARARAFRLQREQGFSASADVLEAALPAALALPDRLARARFLHHCGMVGLALDPAHHGAAAQFFRDELTTLGRHGLGYYRARALLGLATALWRTGQRTEAAYRLDEAVRLSRRIRSGGVKTEALQARVRLQTERP